MSRASGALWVWVLCREGAGWSDPVWTDVDLVRHLVGWGVPESTAYRWVGEWRAVADGRHPQAVPEDQLRALILRRGSALR